MLLALAVNEWNENRVKKDHSIEAVNNIIQVIKKNQKLLAVVSENNQKVVQLILNSENQSATSSKQNFIPGLQIPYTAWKTMMSTGVSEFVNYQIVFSISNVYSAQDIYKTSSYQLIQTMLVHQTLAKALIGDSKSELGNDVHVR